MAFLNEDSEFDCVESVSDDDGMNEFDVSLAPPEELYRFNDFDENKPILAQTLNGKSISSPVFNVGKNIVHSPLGNPLYCKRLQAWYLNKVSVKTENEKSVGNTEKSVLIYENNMFASTDDGDSSDSDEQKSEIDDSNTVLSVDNNVTNTSTSNITNTSLPSLRFDSEFECGNCEQVYRVYGRPCPPVAINTPVHQEYDVTIRKDIYTAGNNQWFFFSASNSSISQSQMAAVTGPGAQRPLTVRFNITNLLKKDSLYNFGMKAAVYSHKHSESSHSVGWHHSGEYICYYKNGLTIAPKKKKSLRRRSLYTVTFTYTFQYTDDTVYFAYCFPYTYTQLQKYIVKLESNSEVRQIMRRQKLCDTLAGNRCDMLTVSEPVSGPIEAVQIIRPAIVISARVHPGETNSSFAMQGLIDFITSSHPDALLLRKLFVFKIIPMLNPDGVIHGNNRCNLAGTDLNRRYLETHDFFHPTVHALKELLSSMQQTRGVLMYLDLHGHSKKKNSFLYGCDIAQQSERYANIVNSYSKTEYLTRRIFPRIFPRLLCAYSNSNANANSLPQSSETAGKLNLEGKQSPMSSTEPLDKGYFSWKDCCFKVQKSKAGCGRVVAWRKCLIEAAYTIELSFCSNGNNSECKLIKQFINMADRNNNASNVTSNSTGVDTNGFELSQLSNEWRQLVVEINAVTNNAAGIIKQFDTEKASVDTSHKSNGGISRRSSVRALDLNSGSNEPVESLIEPADVTSPEYIIFQMHKLFQSQYQYDCKPKDIQSQASYHYTVQDYYTIGQHIGLAIARFCNLTEANVIKETNRLKFLASLKISNKSSDGMYGITTPLPFPGSVKGGSAATPTNSGAGIAFRSGSSVPSSPSPALTAGPGGFGRDSNSNREVSTATSSQDENESGQRSFSSRRAGHAVFEASTNALLNVNPMMNKRSLSQDVIMVQQVDCPSDHDRRKSIERSHDQERERDQPGRDAAEDDDAEDGSDGDDADDNDGDELVGNNDQSMIDKANKGKPPRKKKNSKSTKRKVMNGNGTSSSTNGVGFSAEISNDATKKSSRRKRTKNKDKEMAPIPTDSSMIDLISGNMFDVPLTKPTVFTVESLNMMMELRSTSTKIHTNSTPATATAPPMLSWRHLIEMKLWQSLQLEMDLGSEITPMQLSSDTDAGALDEMIDDAGSVGSDSDPSVDNLPLYEVIQQSKKQMKSTGKATIFARCKMSKKWIKKEKKLKAERKQAGEEVKEAEPAPPAATPPPRPTFAGSKMPSFTRCPAIVRTDKRETMSIHLNLPVASAERVCPVPVRSVQLDLNTSKYGSMSSGFDMGNSGNSLPMNGNNSGNSISPKPGALFRQSSSSKLAAMSNHQDTDSGRLSARLTNDRNSTNSSSNHHGLSNLQQDRNEPLRPMTSNDSTRSSLSSSLTGNTISNGRIVTGNNSVANTGIYHRTRSGKSSTSALVTVGSQSQAQRSRSITVPLVPMSGPTSATNTNILTQLPVQLLPPQLQMQSQVETSNTVTDMPSSKEFAAGVASLQTIVASPISRHRKLTISPPSRDSPNSFMNAFSNKLALGINKDKGVESLPDADHSNINSNLVTNKLTNSVSHKSRANSGGNITLPTVPMTAETLASFSPHSNPNGYGAVGNFPVKLFGHSGAGAAGVGYYNNNTSMSGHSSIKTVMSGSGSGSNHYHSNHYMSDTINTPPHSHSIRSMTPPPQSSTTTTGSSSSNLLGKLVV